MTLDNLKWIAVVVLFLSGLIGGLLPWQLRRGRNMDFWFSLGNAFAGGVFLAIGLIHMLPDAASSYGKVWPDVTYPVVYLLAACTFMGLLLLERVLAPHSFDEVKIAPKLEQRGSNGSLPAYLLLITLSIHSVLAGLALGVQDSIADTGVILVALLAHKGVAAFALGVSLFRTSVSFRAGLVFILFFSLTTPLGVSSGMIFTQASTALAREAAEAIFNALAAGTFLYIAALDIFSEEFLRPRHRNWKFAASLIGFGAMAIVAIWT